MSGFWGGMRGLKVKELQPYVLKHAKDHWTPEKLVKNTKDFIHEYKVKHIDTGSATPLFHTMAIVFFGSYALAYPHEIKHYRAEQQAKLDKELGREPAAHH